MDRSNSWQVSIWKIEEKEKGIVLEYLKQTTKAIEKSSQEIDCSEKKEEDAPNHTGNRHVFRRYGTSDIARV